MAKLRKVKKSKKYGYNVNRKRLRSKLNKLPVINCSQIKEAWESNKSINNNLGQMGLAYDANEVLKIPKIKEEMMKITKRIASDDEADTENQIKKRIPSKIKVAMDLEADAKAPRERRFQLPKGQVQFLTYLMDKYDDDYKAMVRDKKNYYQLTWKQIKSKINVFKGIPEQYADYLLQKGEIVLSDPTPLEETRKQIAQENLKKHCMPKKEKKKKPRVSQWIEENVDNPDIVNEFDTSKMLDDSKNNKINKEKKLKLFPDDDEEDKNNAESQKNTLNTSKGTSKRKEKKTLFDRTEDSDLELDDDSDKCNFKDLSDCSNEELSDDDFLHDKKFITNSDTK